MSIHSSLRVSSAGKKHRSVLKRYERLKMLKDKSLWSEEKSALGIPKVKMQRIKVKKEKTTAEGTATAVAAAPAGAKAAAAPAKAAAPAGKADKK